mgnify:CR=1 FL=1
MAKTIYIEKPNGFTYTEVVFNIRDFVELIAKELGPSARDYLEDLINERDDATRRVLELEEECDPETAYQQGYTAGYDDGYDDGLRDGEREGLDG